MSFYFKVLAILGIGAYWARGLKRPILTTTMTPKTITTPTRSSSSVPAAILVLEELLVRRDIIVLEGPRRRFVVPWEPLRRRKV